jgi:hypothetical protein
MQGAGDRCQENDLVFASKAGTEMDRHNVLRGFRLSDAKVPPRAAGRR